MAIIDQRILIPARQDVVWAYISDLSRNPEWQADCQSVSFLSTKHSGQGTRWRSTTDRGKDTVLEVTSWYNGLGYEYIYVDGVPWKENKGRLRLQEIPEGTVVQWTFTFETGGLFGGRGSRQVDATMAASLKALYKEIKAFNQAGALEAKSLIREAPDVEARAAYKPRHPSALTDAPRLEVDEDAVLLEVAGEPAAGTGDAALVPAIDLTHEPPVAVEDTKPRPAVTEPEGDARFARRPEPELTEALDLVSLAAQSTPSAVADTPAPVAAEAGAENVPETPPAPAVQPEPEATAAPPAEPEPLPRAERTAAVLAEAAAAATLPPADTAGKSIWEVFGVKPPSVATTDQPETQAIASVEPTAAVEPAKPQESVTPAAPPIAEPPAAPVDASSAVAEVPTPAPAAPDDSAAKAVSTYAPGAHTPRRGLRATERRALVSLRRPN